VREDLKKKMGTLKYGISSTIVDTKERLQPDLDNNSSRQRSSKQEAVATDQQQASNNMQQSSE
jgi:hypothetical protein